MLELKTAREAEKGLSLATRRLAMKLWGGRRTHRRRSPFLALADGEAGDPDIAGFLGKSWLSRSQTRSQTIIPWAPVCCRMAMLRSASPGQPSETSQAPRICPGWVTVIRQEQCPDRTPVGPVYTGRAIQAVTKPPKRRIEVTIPRINVLRKRPF